MICNCFSLGLGNFYVFLGFAVLISLYVSHLFFYVVFVIEVSTYDSAQRKNSEGSVI